MSLRTIEELYEEYGKTLAVQKNVIEHYRTSLDAAQKKSDFKEVKRLNGLLCVLYEEKSELEERTTGLRNYLS